MSILNDAQKSALIGRFLGLPEQPASSAVPERSRPSGTVAGTEPMFLSQITSNKPVMIVAGIVGVLAVIALARKVF